MCVRVLSVVYAHFPMLPGYPGYSQYDQLSKCNINWLSNASGGYTYLHTHKMAQRPEGFASGKKRFVG